jgi:hypothetical protein
MLNNNDVQNLPNEEWLPVKNYENLYWISSLGRVKNARKIMKPYKINSGYLCIDFNRNLSRQKFLMHRLVAQAFLPNDDLLPEVNHINENKEDNSVTNLQWCTSSANKQHSIASGTYDAIFTTNNTLGKKHLPNTSSSYHNVTYDKRRGKWAGTIRHNGKNLERKRFNTEVEAALYINYLIDKYGFTDRPKNIIVEKLND